MFTVDICQNHEIKLYLETSVNTEILTFIKRGQRAGICGITGYVTEKHNDNFLSTGNQVRTIMVIISPNITLPNITELSVQPMFKTTLILFYSSSYKGLLLYLTTIYVSINLC